MKVKIYDVGLRDGLQNEKNALTYEMKKNFIEGLSAAGLREIEIGSFVREDRVPQMAGSDFLTKEFTAKKWLVKINPWVLVPNAHGLKNALASGASHVAFFTATSETFNQKNIGMSVSESLAVIEGLSNETGKKTERRAYVSTAFYCPYEGKMTVSKTIKLLEKLRDYGIKKLSIGDTIGMATPNDVKKMLAAVDKSIGLKNVSMHFHDTWGTALANILMSLEMGVTEFDSSAGGLGGCPYAPGASGNVATEDLVFMLEGMGIETGVDLEKLCLTSLDLLKALKRPIPSKALQAFASAC